MKRPTLLARIRFPFDLVQRVDALGTQVRALVHKRVPRARMVRALVVVGLAHATAPEIAPVVAADNVRQGRERGTR